MATSTSLNPSPEDSAATDPVAGSHGLGLGFNRALNDSDRSERIFAFHAERLKISRLLDVGANSGQFAAKLRRLGFAGTIYSVEPLEQAHAELRRHAHTDLSWVPLCRQAAGRTRARLDLNVAQNGYSSSFLPAHENHLRAAPESRAIGSETVFVTSTADLLREGVMQQIDALKIDVQGYELEVIKGLGPHLRHIQLLLVEMSMIECYVGAPDLFAVDKLLVETMGFHRVSLEPSYYDDKTGVVQQFDGIYRRDSSQQASSLGYSPGAISAVVTSMGGVPSRLTPSGLDIGVGWLKRCMVSWLELASRVISVSEIAPMDPRIQWLEAESRPAIADLLAAIPENEAAPAILCNADIMIGDEFRQLLPQLDPLTLYLANRIEVEVGRDNPKSIEVQGYYQWGFDLVVVPCEFARFTRETQPLAREFRIGEPWWDYLLPLVALAAGFPVKRLPIERGLALHYRHPPRYHQQTWLDLGERFLSSVASLANESAARDIDLLYDIKALTGPLDERLRSAAGIVCSRLG